MLGNTMIIMFKFIFEELLKGNMERVTKHSNNLNTLLLLGCLYYGWQNHNDIVNIRHALYYKLNINVDAPDSRRQPLDKESQNYIPRPDIILSETEVTQKEN